MGEKKGSLENRRGEFCLTFRNTIYEMQYVFRIFCQFLVNKYINRQLTKKNVH